MLLRNHWITSEHYISIHFSRFSEKDGNAGQKEHNNNINEKQATEIDKFLVNFSVSSREILLHWNYQTSESKIDKLHNKGIICFFFAENIYFVVISTNVKTQDTKKLKRDFDSQNCSISVIPGQLYSVEIQCNSTNSDTLIKNWKSVIRAG